MKYIENYKLFESKEKNHPGFPTNEEDIEVLCYRYDVTEYDINDDLSIDVFNSVYLNNYGLTYIPLNFNYVDGNFKIANNNLISLKGCPKKVNGGFYCYQNLLKDLKYCPSEVNGDFNFEYNSIKSLEFSPEVIPGLYSCIGNGVESLKYSPKKIGGDFLADYNNINSLKEGPEVVEGNFHCSGEYITSLEGIPNVQYRIDLRGNPVNSVVKNFINNNNKNDLIQEFNEYHIIRGNKIILNRLNTFIDDYGLSKPDMNKIKEYYEII